MITNFVTVTNLDMRNTFAGLILPSVTSVFYIYLLKENFEQVPDELYRAAKVDGTSDTEIPVEGNDPHLPADHRDRHHSKDHRVLELLRMAAADHRRSFLLSCLQRDPGNPGERIRSGEYSGNDGRCGRDLRSADHSVSCIPQKDHGGSLKRRIERMKKLRKVLAILFAAVLCLPILSGCHGRQEQAAFTVPEEFDTSRDYEITFWAKNDTNKIQTEIYRQAIEGFQELYPNITVNLRLYTDYGDIYNDVINNISTNTTPNVCITYPDHIATYLTGDNVVVPLDELMENDRYGLSGSDLLFDGPKESEIVPQFLEECMIGNHYYALPYMRSTEACYINKTYVEELGYTLPDTLTWDFIWEVSEAATQKNADGTYMLNGQEVMDPFYL